MTNSSPTVGKTDGRRFGDRGRHGATGLEGLADDQESVRVGFRLALDSQPDMEVISEASDGQQAVELTAKLTPDVVFADIRMPRPDCLELLPGRERR
ncbi:response regulator transcription factor [Streptomyces fimicarius]|uniref:response regulator transcription factor n=1 Tax=Streptomyces griseus TaxID=1911 RepID=UPI0035DCD183